MEFVRPHLLGYLWLLPLGIAFAVVGERRRRERLVKAAGKSMALRRGVVTAKTTLMIAALGLIILALAGPRWGFAWTEVKHHGSDLVVVVDVSKSMLAQDTEPSRLGRARREITDLLGSLKGDRVGLVAFAGASFVECPLTEDYAAVRQYIEYLDAELIPVQGTDLGGAINLGLKALAAGGEGGGSGRALVVISDGEDFEGRVDAAAAAAKAQGVKIYALGLGTAEGAPIPEPGGGFKKDRAGNVVVTHGDETGLSQLALATGGIYARSVAGQGTLQTLYEDGIRKAVSKTDRRETRERLWFERFQWFLGLALLCLAAEPWLRDVHAGSKTAGGLLLLLGLAGTALGFLPDEGLAGPVDEAKSAFDAGDFATAAQHFADAEAKDPSVLEHAYNRAVSQYRQGDFAGAEAGFAKAAEAGRAQPATQGMAERSYFNLGNAQAEQGKLDEAIKSYDQALTLKPDDKDVRENLAYVKQAKQQQQQNQQQNQQQQNQQQQNQQQQNQQQQNQQQQNQQQQNQQQQNQQQQKQDQQQQQQSKETSQAKAAQQAQDADPKKAQEQKAAPSQDEASGAKPKEPKPDQATATKPQEPQPNQKPTEPKPQPPTAPNQNAAQEQQLAQQQPGTPPPKPGSAGANAVDPKAQSREDAERILRSVDDNVKRFLYQPSSTAPATQLEKDW